MTLSLEPLQIRVPANFGVKNLDAPFHSNISLTLQEGASYRANSVILSYNSPVFERLFLELNQTVLDMDDFSLDAVRSFVRALYAGRVKLDTKQFRDMSKMGKVFSVGWVQERCKEFWMGLLEKVDYKSPYSTFQFLVDEAHYVNDALKDRSYIDRFITKICGLENKVGLFIEPYMADYTVLKDSQLSLAIQVAKPGQSCILKIMKKSIENWGFVFDRASRYLLQNLDLALCIEQDDQGFEEVFDLLTDTNINLSSDYLCVVNKLYRSTVKEQLKKVKESKSATSSYSIQDARSSTSERKTFDSLLKENVNNDMIEHKSMKSEGGWFGYGRGVRDQDWGNRSRGGRREMSRGQRYLQAAVDSELAREGEMPTRMPRTRDTGDEYAGRGWGRDRDRDRGRGWGRGRGSGRGRGRGG